MIPLSLATAFPWPRRNAANSQHCAPASTSPGTNSESEVPACKQAFARKSNPVWCATRQATVVENEVEAREVVEELSQVGIPEAGALNNTNWRATSTKVVVFAIVIITEMSNNMITRVTS